MTPVSVRRRARPSLRTFARDDRGAAMVEFAIVAPFLLLLVFGIIDFGRFFFDYHHLTNAARDGARLAAVLPRAAAATPTTVTEAVVSRVDDTRMTAGMVALTYPTDYGYGEATVRVTISNYPFAAVTPLIPLPNKLPPVSAEFRYELQ